VGRSDAACGVREGVDDSASPTETFLQQRAFRWVLTQLQRTKSGLAGEGRFTNLVEQLGPSGVEQVIAAERDRQVVDLA
jgi:hypothetical protein